MGEDIIPGEINPQMQAQPEPVPVQVRPDLHLVDSVMTDPTTAHAVEVSQGLIEDAVRPAPDTVIEDKVKAWDMAHASHEARSNAAEIREAAAKTDDLFNAFRNKDEEGATEAKQWLTENPNHSPSLRTQTTTFNEANDGKAKESSVAVSLRKDAEIIDDRARKIEDWAGALHDHPVGNEFKMKYPDIEFTPSHLADLEALNDDDQTDIAESKLFLDRLSGADVITSLINEDGKIPNIDDLTVTYSDAYHGANEYRDKIDEFFALIHKGETTLDQIKTFYAEMYTRAYITPKKARISIMNSLFNEIKSGQASPAPQTHDQNFE